MLSTFGLLLIVLCVQHITAGHEHFHIKPGKSDDIHVLADFLKNYISTVHGYNRQLISIKYFASNVEQAQKQSDIIRTTIGYSKDLNVTYTFFDLNGILNNLNNFRGLSVMLVDDPEIFR